MNSRATTKKALLQCKKDAAVYRKAAHHMESAPGDEYARYSCVAIAHVAGDGVGRVFATRYAETFGYGLPPYVHHGESIECSLQGGFSALTEEERQDARILALCFMAALVEAGDA